MQIFDFYCYQIFWLS